MEHILPFLCATLEVGNGDISDHEGVSLLSRRSESESPSLRLNDDREEGDDAEGDSRMSCKGGQTEEGTWYGMLRVLVGKIRHLVSTIDLY